VQDAKRTGDLARIKAMILVDMIGDRDLVIKREPTSTSWLTDIIWTAAKALGHGAVFSNETFTVEDDHIPFLNAGVPAVDLIDLEYPPWHTAEDTLDKVSARSMEVVGRVLTAALPKIESRLLGPAR
jgi:Zn-dependent M28 family amino/carboxypeptidase